jgi:hypothetical protein
VQLWIGQLMLELGVFGKEHVDRLHRLRHVTPPAPVLSRPPTSITANANRRPACAT